MKVLVTGASGFIGGWLCRRLVAEGLNVTALVRNASDVTELESLGVSFVYGDVCDLDSLLKAFEGMDAVFHLAGVIGYSSEMRPLMERVNVFGTRQVLKACRQKNIKKMLYMSSVVAVGASKIPTPLTEEFKYNLKDLDLGYFETKKRAEDLVLEAQARSDIDAIIVNPATTYGYKDALKGSRKTQVKVAQGNFPFYPYGGVNVVGIEDLMDGIWLAWTKGTPGERYILGGENLTIKELFTMIAEEAGVPPPFIPLPKWLLYIVGYIGDLLVSFGKKGPITLENAKTATLFHWFDCSKARRELGFSPRSAREAIKNSVQWMRDQNLLQG